MPETPFNPLNKSNLGVSVANALLSMPPVPLSSLSAFNGAGIYAIYYVGEFNAYDTLRTANTGDKFTLPIYVGKAVPKGARKGASDTVTTRSKALFQRLTKHAASIDAASNLQIEDFYCRYLSVDDIWIALGESLMISRYSPLWNTALDGFGNNDPGSGRYAQLRSKWDVLHPGRPWALKCKEREDTEEQIAMEAATFLRSFTSICT